MVARLPKLYDSAEDAAFDADPSEYEDTLPQGSVDASGLRTFFDRVVAELEQKNKRRRTA